MKRLAFPAFILLSALPALGQPIIIDHTSTDLAKVPPAWITQAKNSLRISYGHTSHGSQLVTGIMAFRGSSGDPYYFTYSSGVYQAGTFLNDYYPSGDLGNPDRTTWATRTRDLLNRSGGCDRNVILWSWCGQADGTAADIDLYLSLMNQLEADYPQVKFVYMTGHLNGTGAAGNLNLRNEQIRNFCRTNNKILFDFADIESYDPDGLVNYMVRRANDNCDYDSDGNGSLDRNWAATWVATNPTHELTQLVNQCGSCAHSQRLNCILKGRAFWWLMARLAGWSGVNPSYLKKSVDFNRDGQEDILWRYGGPGGYNVVWYLGYFGGAAAPPAFQSLSRRGTPGTMRVVDMLEGKAPQQVFRDPREAGGALEKAVWTAAEMTIPRDVRMMSDPRPGPAAPGLRTQGVDFLGTATLYEVPDTTWEIGATGDFSGDGKTDILWRYNGPGGYNVVWYLDGVTFLGTVTFPAVTDPAWKIVGTGDFNGDGKLDILWRYNGSGGYNVVWYLDGASVIGAAGLEAVTDPTWEVGGVGDFDGNGWPDILWRYNGAGGNNMLWHMSGVTKVDSHVMEAVTDPTWKIGGVGDFNRDGKLDILWRYYGLGGYNVVWFMNDLTRLGWEPLSAVTDPTWRIQNH